MGSLARIAANDNAAGKRTSALLFPAKRGRLYRFAVDGKNGVSGKFGLHWRTVSPSNDDFSEAKLISGSSGQVVANTTGATRQAHEPEGTATLWYRWRATASGSFLFTTEAALDYTNIAVFRGRTLSTLTMLFPRRTWYGRVVHVTKGRSYSIQVYTGSGTNGDIAFAWRRVFKPANDDLADAKPLSGQTGSASGNNYLASEQRDEPDDFSYPQASVWFRWTAPANGTYTFSARGSQFETVLSVYGGTSFGSLRRVTASDYSFPVEFGANAGQTFSISLDTEWGEVGRLALRWVPKTRAPDNDNFEAAPILSGSKGWVHGNAYEATTELDEPLTGYRTVWYAWTAPATGMVDLSTGSGFDPEVEVFTGNRMGSLTRVPHTDHVANYTSTPTFRFLASAGTTYRIVVNDIGPYGLSEFTLKWNQQPPPNDAFAAATVITGWSGQVLGDNVLATQESGEPGTARPSVWFRWTAPMSGSATFTTAGSDFRSEFEVYRGNALGSLTFVTREAFDETELAAFDASSGTTYYVTVYGGEGDIILSWNRTGGETIPPYVSVTSPSEGDRRGGMVGLTAHAVDNTVIQSVSFFARGALVEETYARPYSVDWEISGVPDGPAEIYAVARDLYGNETTSATVTIQVDNTPPDTSVTSGPSGTSSSNMATFSAEASEPGSKFECSLDGGEFLPCPASVRFTNLAEGLHRFAVRAIDVANNIDPRPAIRVWSIDY